MSSRFAGTAKGRMYKVKEVASISGVSVRALHHYDELGLLTPSNRSRAGYRLYTDKDLLRLQQILIERELGMPLESIRRSLDDPDFDRRKTLQKQREALAKRAERTRQMLQAIDAALAALNGEKTMQDMTERELTALFDGFDPAKYEDETKERWGGTEAYEESARRMKRYTAADWERYKAESDDIMKSAADLFHSGTAVDDEAAMALAERHRRLIDRWFYPCSPQMHSGLANLYETDPRFAENIDKYGENFTSWWSSAIRANAAR